MDVNFITGNGYKVEWVECGMVKTVCRLSIFEFLF